MLQGPAASAHFVPLYSGGDEPTSPVLPARISLVNDLPSTVRGGCSRHG
jgi:6-phosphogluconolactonase